MTRLTFSMARYWPYLLIGVIAVFDHSLLLLNDGTYWVEWILGSYLAEDNWIEVHGWDAEADLPAEGVRNFMLNFLKLRIRVA